jgi:NAD(P)-dependent dehydrogenase (short-subunit alcohol dehydrogenase family)
MSLKGKTLFITGASRGIGLAIGLRAARDGANVAIAAKTTEPHPKLPGTIYTAAQAIEEAGGKALPLLVDVRDEEAVASAIERTAETFGGIEIVVNNASAISLTSTPQTDMKRFDLMHQVNTRGTYMVSKYAIPHLERAANPHILMLSPPLDFQEKWFAPHLAYSLAKYGMSLCVLGLAGELRRKGMPSTPCGRARRSRRARSRTCSAATRSSRRAGPPRSSPTRPPWCSKNLRAASPGTSSSTTPSWRARGSPISQATASTRRSRSRPTSSCPMGSRRPPGCRLESMRRASDDMRR